MEQLQVQLDESFAISQSEDESPNRISRWLQENTFQIHSASLEGTYRSSAFTAELRQAAFNFEMQRGNTLPSIQARAGGMYLQAEGGDIALEGTNLNLTSKVMFPSLLLYQHSPQHKDMAAWKILLPKVPLQDSIFQMM